MAAKDAKWSTSDWSQHSVWDSQGWRWVDDRAVVPPTTQGPIVPPPPPKAQPHRPRKEPPGPPPAQFRNMPESTPVDAMFEALKGRWCDAGGSEYEVFSSGPGLTVRIHYKYGRMDGKKVDRHGVIRLDDSEPAGRRIVWGEHATFVLTNPPTEYGSCPPCVVWMPTKEYGKKAKGFQWKRLSAYNTIHQAPASAEPGWNDPAILCLGKKEDSVPDDDFAQADILDAAANGSAAVYLAPGAAEAGWNDPAILCMGKKEGSVPVPNLLKTDPVAFAAAKHLARLLSCSETNTEIPAQAQVPMEQPDAKDDASDMSSEEPLGVEPPPGLDELLGFEPPPGLA